jgi:hypothetical protein
VLLGSGDFFSVQLMNTARRSEKSYVGSVMERLSSAQRARDNALRTRNARRRAAGPEPGARPPLRGGIAV